MSRLYVAPPTPRNQILDTGLGFIAETAGGLSYAGAQAMSNQNLRAAAIGLRAGDVVSNVIVCVQTAAVGTSGVVNVGLYDATYNKLVGSGDVNNPQTVTVTIASPAVFSLTAHGFSAGDPVSFKTTGALPTGLSVDTAYFVIAAGLTANAFEVSATVGGSAVNTSGSQSGTHTVTRANLRVTGLQPLPLGSSYTVTADGLYYPVFLMTTAYGTTQPSIAAGALTGLGTKLASGNYPNWNQGSQSSLPTTATPAASSITVWFAVS